MGIAAWNAPGDLCARATPPNGRHIRITRLSITTTSGQSVGGCFLTPLPTSQNGCWDAQLDGSGAGLPWIRPLSHPSSRAHGIAVMPSSGRNLHENLSALRVADRELPEGAGSRHQPRAAGLGSGLSTAVGPMQTRVRPLMDGFANRSLGLSSIERIRCAATACALPGWWSSNRKGDSSRLTG